MNFAHTIISWQKKFGRHDLPWQEELSSYRVWISEIMLQQTQVATVKSYFIRFIQRFPDASSLAKAPLDDVLSLWAGLGYYRRAQHLHTAAQIVHEQYQGEVPTDPTILVTLPGIGQSTAHAIASIAGNLPYAILDANVKRVLARFLGIREDVEQNSVKSDLFTQAQALMPQDNCRIYTQGMMDLGATVCTKNPTCTICPIQKDCIAQKKHWQLLIPLKKKKKTKPTRLKYYLLAFNKENILLVKRSDQTIWSNLWCLPEFTSEIELNDFIPSAYTGASCNLTELRHTFTHFHLRLMPVLVDSSALDFTWPANIHKIPLKSLSEYGLPAPIEKILNSRIIAT